VEDASSEGPIRLEPNTVHEISRDDTILQEQELPDVWQSEDAIIPPPVSGTSTGNNLPGDGSGDPGTLDPPDNGNPETPATQENEDPFYPRSIPAAGYVSLADTGFSLDGTSWRPFGVQYWPSYVHLDTDGKDVANHWLHPARFQTAVVRNELADIASLGFNAIGIQVRSELLPCSNLELVLDVAREHEMKVLVFIPNCDPFKLHLEGKNADDACTAFLKSCNLEKRPEIFAYDLAWEPRVGNHNQEALVTEWHDWLLDRYETFAHAQQSLGVSFSFEDRFSRDGYYRFPEATLVCSPSEDETRLSLAYLRFLDDWMSRQYSRVLAAIRRIDPHHLVTARTGFGLLFPAHCSELPVDVRAVSGVLDFAGPEFYRQELDTVGSRAGFLSAYSSMPATKPVVFLEYGYDFLAGGNEQQRFYQEFYRAVQESHAQGSFAWWYTGKNSRDETTNDFGIVGPVGEGDRPVLKTIAAEKAALTTQLPQDKREVRFLTFDRDDTVNRAQKRLDLAETYAANHSAGYTTKVITPCSNTTSAQPRKGEAIMCVGNVPYNFHCPATCLGGHFDLLQIKDAQGQWYDVEDYSVIPVKAGEPVTLRAVIKNTGEAAWLDVGAAGATKGSVRLGNKKRHIRIMPLGDSRTNRPGLQSYRYWLQQRLRTAGYNAIDFVGVRHDGVPELEYDQDHNGIPGWTAKRILDGFDKQPAKGSLRVWLLHDRPDIVLIHCGFNDLRSYVQNDGFTWQKAIATTIQDLDALIDFLKGQHPRIVTVVAKIFPGAKTEEFPAVNDAMVTIFNEKLEYLGAEKSTAEAPVIIADHYTGFDIFGVDGADGIHQNESGARKMADRWFDVFKPLLDDSRYGFAPIVTLPVPRRIASQDQWEIPSTPFLKGFSGFRVLDLALNAYNLAWFGETKRQVVLYTVP